MNATLHLNTASIPQPSAAVQSKPDSQPAIPWWLRLFACFFIYADDPAALRYVQSKYDGAWD
jgi:hypothetical protein